MPFDQSSDFVERRVMYSDPLDDGHPTPIPPNINEFVRLLFLS